MFCLFFGIYWSTQVCTKRFNRKGIQFLSLSFLAFMHVTCQTSVSWLLRDHLIPLYFVSKTFSHYICNLCKLIFQDFQLFEKKWNKSSIKNSFKTFWILKFLLASGYKGKNLEFENGSLLLDIRLLIFVLYDRVPTCMLYRSCIDLFIVWW